MTFNIFLRLTLFSACIWMSACNNSTDKSSEENSGGQKTNSISDQTREQFSEDISVEDAEALIAQNSNLVILDVRTPDEYNAGHLENAINYDILAENTPDKIKTLEKGKTYLIYCKGGGRSAKCQKAMDEMGFEKTYNMLGGFTAWEADNLPFVK